MISGKHDSHPATDGILFVDITAPLHQQLSHVQSTRHGSKHEGRGTIFWGETFCLTHDKWPALEPPATDGILFVDNSASLY